jgi:hypothetical protein
MKATELVTKMFDDFERKTGKPPTEMTLAPLLYDSLKSELQAGIPKDMVIDYIKVRGVEIKRQVCH